MSKDAITNSNAYHYYTLTPASGAITLAYGRSTCEIFGKMVVIRSAFKSNATTQPVSGDVFFNLPSGFSFMNSENQAIWGFADVLSSLSIVNNKVVANATMPANTIFFVTLYTSLI